MYNYFGKYSSVSGKTIKFSGAAFSKKIFVSGDYTFDSDFKNVTITGSNSSDTIIARGKKVFVTGGAGADIFVYATGRAAAAKIFSFIDTAGKLLSQTPRTNTLKFSSATAIILTTKNIFPHASERLIGGRNWKLLQLKRSC